MATINYISAIPGIGKTKWVVEQLVKCVQKKDGISIYVAPTTDLLAEVKKYIEMALTGEQAKRVLTFHSKDDKFGAVSQSIKLALEGGVDQHKRIFKRAEKGTVLLITHAGFLSMNKVPRAGSISLYFDEARKCVSQSNTVKLASKAQKDVVKKLLVLEPIENSTFLKATTDITKREYQELMKTTSWETRQRRGIEAIVRSALNPRFETYVKMPKSSASMGMFEVTLPSRIFEGFQHVVLLSAFFEDSQMYHLLKLKGTSMRDVTKTVIEDHFKRFSRIHNRYGKVFIVPLMPQANALSKNHLQGFLISQQHADILTDLQKMGYKTRKDLRVLKEYAMDARAFKLNERDKKALELLKAKSKYLQFDPLKWMLKKSGEIVDQWNSEFENENNKAPLLIVNKLYQRRAEELAPDYKIISTAVHGLNKYYQHDVVIFLAAINPSPEMFTFYRQFLPAYDVEKDHVADVCIQCVCRGSVRDTKATQPSLVIVPDMRIMALLHDKMSFYPTLRADLRPSTNMIAASLNTDASKITVKKLSKAMSVAEKQEKYLKNPINKKLTSLRVMVSQTKKKIEAGTPGAEHKMKLLKTKIDYYTKLREEQKEKAKK